LSVANFLRSGHGYVAKKNDRLAVIAIERINEFSDPGVRRRLGSTV
jgi:hypothetical protein